VTVLLALAAALALEVQDPQAVPTPAQLEAEVLENVKGQPLGDGTVADLGLPDEFLRRVADRIVRSSYEERYRIVVRDAAAPAGAPSIQAWPSLLVLGVGALALASVAWIFVSRRKARAGA
jgi:hypothetical protein